MREPEPGADVDVAPGVPLGEGRQIVRPARRERLGRVAVGRDERALVIALEEQDPIREDLGGVHPFAEAVGHGAEVFTDHETPRARTLQRDDPRQVRERVGDVCAVGRRGAARDPEEPGQRHRVIDP